MRLREWLRRPATKTAWIIGFILFAGINTAINLFLPALIRQVMP